MMMRRRRRRRSRWPRQGREATTGLCFRESVLKTIDYDLNHRSFRESFLKTIDYDLNHRSFRESFLITIDYDLNHRSLLMNSYQLQQQREQRKEVKNYLELPNIDNFEEMGWKKVQRGLSSGSWRGRRVLVVSWSEAPSAKNWVWGPAFGYSVQGELLDNLSCNKLTLKKCFCKILRIGA